jgi:PAS domain S-box-containing protein
VFRPSDLPWQAIAEQASDGLFVLDPAAAVLWGNVRACQLLERELEQISGHPISDFFWSLEDLEREPLRIAELGTGRMTLFQRAVRTGKGERRILEVSARLVDDGLILAIARDVTSRVDAVEQLRRSEEGFRALIERCPEGILVHIGGVMRYVNSALTTMLGYDSPDHFVGSKVADLVHPTDWAKVAARIESLQAGETVVPFMEQRLLRRDGTHLLASVSGVSITYEGQPAIAAIARDVTEQRSTLAQLANAEKMASLGVLSAGVAHEVNNPLAYLTLRLRALASLGKRLEAGVSNTRTALVARLGEDGAKEAIDADLADEHFALFADHVATACEGAERVRVIVEDLRMFSRADSDTGRLLDLRQPLKRALSMVGHRIGHGAEIVFEESATQPVLASEGRLTQVFVNLLVNASQAIAEAETGRHQVHVRLRMDNDDVVVSIRDTGVGIPPENLQRVFEPFFTTKPVGVGTGLGLSICHGIVTVYGGTIRVESRVGEGATFTVAFPRATQPGN